MTEQELAEIELGEIDPYIAIRRLIAAVREATAKLAWHENKPSQGYPWDSPYMDGVESGKAECRAELAEATALLRKCEHNSLDLPPVLVEELEAWLERTTGGTLP